jgi:putative redox protein
MKFMAEAPSGHMIPMDAAKENGGDDSAARPGELTLVALGGCTGFDVVSILTKMRVNLDTLEIIVDGEQRDEYPRVWTKLHLKYILKGKDIDESKVKKAIELSEEKYCFVSAMLSKTAELTWEYEIIQA